MRKIQPFKTETVMKIYTEYPNEVGTEQIQALFDGVSLPTVCKIRKEVRKIMAEKGIRVWGSSNVDTESLFEYAGIDIETYIERNKHRRRLLENV